MTTARPEALQSKLQAQCCHLDHTSCHKAGRVTIGRKRCSVAKRVCGRRLTSLMLRLLHVADAAGGMIANKVNRATDDTKSYRDMYDKVNAELDRPSLSVKLLQLATIPVTDFTAPTQKHRSDTHRVEPRLSCSWHTRAAYHPLHRRHPSVARAADQSSAATEPQRAAAQLDSNDYTRLKLAASQYIGE